MNLVYLLSTELDYGRCIARDCGPSYAKDHGLQTMPWTDAASLPSEVVRVVDTRLQPAEQTALESEMDRTPEVLYLLSVGDPFWEESRKTPYYDFLLRTASRRNVAYVSRYAPSEFTLQLPQEKVVVVPYAYVSRYEVQRRSMDSRKRRMFVAGRPTRELYPLRNAVVKRYQRSPLWRLLVHRLGHPGYPDGSDPVLKHEVLHGAFLEEAARCRFMMCDATRCGMELLKYRECGYAGCVPVGEAPASFPEELRSLVFSLQPDLVGLNLLRVLMMNNSRATDRAGKYRQALQEYRAPGVLQETLKTFARKQQETLVVAGR